MKATFAGGAAVGDAAVLRRLMASSSMLKDSVAPELTVDMDLHRRLLADSTFIPTVFIADRLGQPSAVVVRGARDTVHRSGLQLSIPLRQRPHALN
ncbi:hypothetical protein U9M48_032115 [Paspalum notatum var. saurae]|uniref:Uncharacterized protein n=1 Tax=Paspalum notatum var. saurae TaxID=547442 RepID=A0AAQ3X5E9_PASNO